MLDHIMVLAIIALILLAVILQPRPQPQQKYVVTLMSGVHAMSRGDVIRLIEDAQEGIIQTYKIMNRSEWDSYSPNVRLIGSDLARFINSHPQSGKFETAADAWATKRLFRGADDIDIPLFVAIRNLQIVKLLIAELADIDFASSLDLRWAQTLFSMNHEKPALQPPEPDITCNCVAPCSRCRHEDGGCMEEESRTPSHAPRAKKVYRIVPAGYESRDDRLEKCTLPPKRRPVPRIERVIDYGDMDMLRRKIRGGVPDPTKTKTLAHDYDYLEEDIWQTPQQPTSYAL